MGDLSGWDKVPRLTFSWDSFPKAVKWTLLSMNNTFHPDILLLGQLTQWHMTQHMNITSLSTYWREGCGSYRVYKGWMMRYGEWWKGCLVLWCIYISTSSLTPDFRKFLVLGCISISTASLTPDLSRFLVLVYISISTASLKTDLRRFLVLVYISISTASTVHKYWCELFYPTPAEYLVNLCYEWASTSLQFYIRNAWNILWQVTLQLCTECMPCNQQEIWG